MSICKKESVCVCVGSVKKAYVREREKEKVHSPHNYWAGVLAIAVVLYLHSACRYEPLSAEELRSCTLSSCTSTSPHPARTHGFVKVPLNVIYSPAIITHIFYAQRWSVKFLTTNSTKHFLCLLVEQSGNHTSNSHHWLSQSCYVLSDIKC